ncbi:MAG: AGE family epimerase/isomerase [Vicinamibacteria bacterium]|nr:AGE family epimerase/isomerase [Vicinamibacteria bacterium]
MRGEESQTKNGTTRRKLSRALMEELRNDIIPFWRTHGPDAERGGFIGQMSNDLKVDQAASKGLILNARLLWSFAAFYLHLGDESCLAIARRAYDYIEERFWDVEHGGAFWLLDPDGQPRDMKKKIYGQAFLVYALSEYHRATGSEKALCRAREVFELVEAHARDVDHDGYLETFERDWQPAEDLRLSDDDLNEKKSMNTHLHVMEAYTNLLRVWPDTRLRARLTALIDLFMRHILDPRGRQFRLFFDEAWTVKSDHISFGHDIEGSWLLCEAAEVIGNPRLLDRVREQALAMADAVWREGRDADGGLFYAASSRGVKDSDKHWWPQAEAVVGFLNAFELSKETRFFEAALASWRFIENRIIDRRHGEWFWRVSRDGAPDPNQPKISEWKCPYHNGRMCIEAAERLERLAT